MKKNDVNDLVTKSYMKSYIDDKFETFERKFDTKLEGFRSDILSAIDKILSELENMRENSLIIGHQVDGHEERITRLERKN